MDPDHCDEIVQLQFLSICDVGKDIHIFWLMRKKLLDDPVQNATSFIVGVVYSVFCQQPRFPSCSLLSSSSLIHLHIVTWQK